MAKKLPNALPNNPVNFVVRWPRERWEKAPSKQVGNWQTCDIMDATTAVVDGMAPAGFSPLASIRRSRKTKRSQWVYEFDFIRGMARDEPLKVLDYCRRVIEFAISIEWPSGDKQ